MVLTFLILLQIALAFLAHVLVASPVPLERRAIDEGLLGNLNLFAQFGAAAYCPANNNDVAGGFQVACNTGNCPLVEQADVLTVYEFENSKTTDVTGYVAVDRTRGLTILAFRGSSSARNWFANLDTRKVDVDICSGCSAHQGFWNSWREARTGVMNALMSAAQSHPSFKVVVVGHSLGGAIAAFAAAEIRNSGVNADLYTYGAPRIAGASLSSYITNQNRGGNFRVTHTDDLVPRLPPSILGFEHISPEYWITSPNNVAPTVNDVTRLEGTNNRDGNAGQTLPGVDSHGWYFGLISQCRPEGLTEFKKD
jgi:predicted alpha/beta hydrolase family esterase